MHRHVGGVGHQLACGIEQCAGEVQALLDVDGRRSTLQGAAHGLGDGHEAMSHDLQHHGVQCDIHVHSRGFVDALQVQGALIEHGGLPARGDPCGGGILHAHSGASDHLTCSQFLASPDGNLLPGIVKKDPPGIPGGSCGLVRDGWVRYRWFIEACFQGECFHHQFAAQRGKTEAFPMACCKLLAHDPGVIQGHGHGPVAACHLEVDLGRPMDGLLGGALILQGGKALLAHGLQEPFEVGPGKMAQGLFDASFLQGTARRKPHAVGRQHSGKGMDEHIVHPQGIGHVTGMLWTGTTETLQDMAEQRMALLDGNPLDGPGHVFHRHGDEAAGHRLGGHARCLRNLMGALDGCHAIGRCLPIGTKYPGHGSGVQDTEYHLAVGDGQGTTTAIAGRAWVGAGRFRSGTEACAIEGAHRAATSCHGVDGQGGDAQAQSGDLLFQGALVTAGIMGAVGGGAAHVETDDALEAAGPCGLHGSHDATCRAREQTVAATKPCRGYQHAIGLHHQQGHTPQRMLQLLGVALQHGREVGVHHRGLGAWRQLDQRTDHGAARDMLEADPFGKLQESLFVHWIAEAVGEADGQAADALGVQGLECSKGLMFFEGLDHLALGIETFLHLEHGGSELEPGRDGKIEQGRARLVVDMQDIPETRCDDQGRFGPATLQQGIGAHGGAHAHHGHLVCRYSRARRQAEALDDGSHRRVLAVAGFSGEDLMDGKPTLGRDRHHVGEGPTPVDQKAPAR